MYRTVYIKIRFFQKLHNYFLKYLFKEQIKSFITHNNFEILINLITVFVI